MIEAIIVGLIAGWLAGKLMRGKGYGVVMDIILGLTGALIGSWVFGHLGIQATGVIGVIAMATIGAILLISASRLLSAL